MLPRGNIGVTGRTFRRSQCRRNGIRPISGEREAGIAVATSFAVTIAGVAVADARQHVVVSVTADSARATLGSVTAHGHRHVVLLL